MNQILKKSKEIKMSDTKLDFDKEPMIIDFGHVDKKPDSIFAQEADSMSLSDQALGAVMMALQKSLMEQSDIVPVLKGFKFKLSDIGLMVMNPPLVKLGNEPDDEEGEE